MLRQLSFPDDLRIMYRELNLIVLDNHYLIIAEQKSNYDSFDIKLYLNISRQTTKWLIFLITEEIINQFKRYWHETNWVYE